MLDICNYRSRFIIVKALRELEYIDGEILISNSTNNASQRNKAIRAIQGVY